MKRFILVVVPVVIFVLQGCSFTPAIGTIIAKDKTSEIKVEFAGKSIPFGPHIYEMTVTLPDGRVLKEEAKYIGSSGSTTSAGAVVGRNSLSPVVLSGSGGSESFIANFEYDGIMLVIRCVGKHHLGFNGECVGIEDNVEKYYGVVVEK